MRLRLSAVLIYAGVCSAQVVGTPNQSSAPLQFVTQILAANPALAAIQSANLEGNAQWSAGSSHESGSVHIHAAADGSSSLELSLGKSSRIEKRAPLSSRSCQITGGEGKTRDIKGPECHRAILWFAPMLMVQPAPSLANVIQITDDGAVVRNGSTYHGLTYVTTVPSHDPASQKFFSNSTRVMVLYDPTTFLPVGMEFDEHPSTNLNQSIHVRIAYSAYQMTSGLMVPYHIDRYVNNSLQISITLSNVTLN